MNPKVIPRSASQWRVPKGSPPAGKLVATVG
jgi:hypothetical protein